MYRNLTKLLLGAGVVVILSFLLSASPPSAAKVKPGNLPIDGACADGEIAKWNESKSMWDCAPDTDTHAGRTEIEGLGFVTGAHTTDTHAGRTEIEGLGFVTGPHTTDTDTLDDLLATCTEGQIAKNISGVWVCADPDAGLKFVFVTSGKFDSDMGGLEGADAICNHAAGSIGSVVAPGFYHAWLSTDTVDARDRLTPGVSGYLNAEGTLVANSNAELLNSSILLHAPIDLSEFGNVPVDSVGFDIVFTNTLANGTHKRLSCGNWAGPPSPRGHQHRSL